MHQHIERKRINNSHRDTPVRSVLPTGQAEGTEKKIFIVRERLATETQSDIVKWLSS